MLDLFYQTELFWLYLGIASFLTGFIASIGGAGGLIIMPFMIWSGISPQAAVATAKFSSLGMWSIVLSRFKKAKLISWNLVFPMSILGAIGGVLGAKIAITMDENIIIFVFGVLFLIIGSISMLKPAFGTMQIKTSKRKILIGLILYFLIMALGGFFPAGISIIIIFTLVTFMGLDALQAHATDVFPWIIQTITSTLVYLYYGMVDFYLVLPLFIGMALGGHFGSRIAVQKGARFVKLFISILAIGVGIYWVIKYGAILFLG